jgi:hypothetical protein
MRIMKQVAVYCVLQQTPRGLTVVVQARGATSVAVEAAIVVEVREAAAGAGAAYARCPSFGRAAVATSTRSLREFSPTVATTTMATMMTTMMTTMQEDVRHHVD